MALHSLGHNELWGVLTTLRINFIILQVQSCNLYVILSALFSSLHFPVEDIGSNDILGARSGPGPISNSQCEMKRGCTHNETIYGENGYWKTVSHDFLITTHS